MADSVMDAGRLRTPAATWLDVMEGEYLSDFIRSGGSAVKFVSGSDPVLFATAQLVQNAAGLLGYYTVALDPAVLRSDGKKPDVHRIERFFLEATSGVDWKAWASTEARAFLAGNGVRIGADRQLSDVEGIAEDNGFTSAYLRNLYEVQFARPLVRDHSLSLEFRTALAALGRAQLDPDAMTPITEEVLLAWLAGQSIPGAAAALKRIHIFGRIDRSNARHMFASFCRWLPRTGRAGTVAILDFRPYEVKRKTATQRNSETLRRLRDAIDRGAPPDELEAIKLEGESEPPVSYSQSAYLLMLQLLRRFIDDLDTLERFCLVVLTSPSFYLETSERNYVDYEALQTRIGLEIHDAQMADPAAALVHLEESS